jgi:hypothetical protein
VETRVKNKSRLLQQNAGGAISDEYDERIFVWRYVVVTK